MIFRSARYFAARFLARGFDRIYRVHDDGMPEPQLFVRQRGRDFIGRDAGLIPCDSIAPHGRLDRIDRKYRYRQTA